MSEIEPTDRDARFAKGPTWVPDPDEISDREAMAHAAGYAQALEDCKDADTPKLIRERDILRVDLAFVRARLRVAERTILELKARIAVTPNV